ncbi:hypothetical protein BTJ39_00855 [Izhakiella australiensis]|uniref:Fe/B12 periplasmic-binding domain-containing protein n=2 Tax=Izhakiella australiensis TaxID=1926881 RepID=A0A1S8YSC2_9GAMM|nr:hypothetical protein BTJ39_00855 [Izhakiella australiensis]
MLALAPVSTAVYGSSDAGGVVVLDWMLTESLLLLGITPLAMANPAGFRQTFHSVSLPASVKDVGLIYQPNLELLTLLRPRLIIISPSHAAIAPLLEKIAPTLSVGAVQGASASPFTQVCAALTQLGAFFHRTERARAVILSAQKAIETARRRVVACQTQVARKIFIVQFIDEAFIRLFGLQSLYGEMLERVGAHNACTLPTPVSGFTTTGYDALYAQPDALLVGFAPLSAAVQTMLRQNPVWQALPFRQPGRHVLIPLIPPNGGVASAMAFAERLAQGIAIMSGAPDADLGQRQVLP